MVLGVEHGDASGVPLRQRRHAAGRGEPPAMGIIGVLLNGIIGIVSEPVRCRSLCLQVCSIVTASVA